MLKKSAIVVLYPKEDQFLSSLFLVKRKDGGGEEGWGGGWGESPITPKRVQ